MKDFLKIGDSEYRVEANWNAIDDILPLMHCCIKEGERLEKRNFPMSESELGSVVNTAVMGQFMRIYARQSQMEADGGSGKKK